MEEKDVEEKENRRLKDKYNGLGYCYKIDFAKTKV
jgi:hypothetical protein